MNVLQNASVVQTICDILPVSVLIGMLIKISVNVPVFGKIRLFCQQAWFETRQPFLLENNTPLVSFCDTTIILTSAY